MSLNNFLAKQNKQTAKMAKGKKHKIKKTKKHKIKRDKKKTLKRY